jgi:muramoyltetrapeptide carboxypeptidase
MKRSEFIKAGAGIFVSTQLPFAKYESVKRSVIYPKTVKPGDRIAVMAPAGAVWDQKEKDKITSLFRTLGWEPVLGKTISQNDGYLAGTDEFRAQEFMQFMADKSIKAIFTMRGGWGSARILDLLNYEIISANPKIILGFSDITSLLNTIYLKTGLVTFHGPCIYSTWNKFSVDALKALIEKNEVYHFKNKDMGTLQTLRGGKAKGVLVGGNLSVLTSLLGTRYEPDWEGKILFLEEISEEPYRIDRMLWQLKSAGVFTAIRGLVLGAFKNCTAEFPTQSYTLEEVLDQYFHQASFPVMSGASFGHVLDKYTLPIGAEVFLNTDTFDFHLQQNVLVG